MSGYKGFEKKKSKLGTTLVYVAVVHLALGGFLYWLSTTDFGKEMIRVYKLNMSKQKEEPPPLPEPEPPKEEPPPPPPKKAEQPPPEAAPPPPPEPVKADAARPQPQVESANPFAIGKGRKFGGYVDLLTVAIQQHYKQPPDLPPDIEYAVLCQLVIDEQGRVLDYQLVNSSGSPLFDESALQALSQVTQVRPPPEGMDRTVVVKFFPPT
jgi:protein TonB